MELQKCIFIVLTFMLRGYGVIGDTNIEKTRKHFGSGTFLASGGKLAHVGFLVYSQSCRPNKMILISQR